MSMKLVDINSPPGDELRAVYAAARHDIIGLLMSGAPGRRIEDLALDIHGTASSTRGFKYESTDFIEVARLVAAYPDAGSAVAASVPRGHLLVRIRAGEFVALTTLRIPPAVEEARRFTADIPAPVLEVLREMTRPEAAQTARRQGPCPCGSGRKFKRCCAT